jgi:tyrosine-protein kinase Etk/Wzc
VRNGILAFFASLLIGSLIAIGRDQLRPHVRGARELSRITGQPVLGKIPYARRRLRRRPAPFARAEDSAYETLQTVVTLQLPSNLRPVILVTSALRGEGKSRLVAGLGRALARKGHDTLLVSADLRQPKLHDYFGVAKTTGLADLLLARLEHQDGSSADLRSAISEVQLESPGSGALGLLISGPPPANPARLLSRDLLEPLFDEIRYLSYDYVLVDSPPLLGVGDAHVLSQWSTLLLIVARVEQLRVENATDLREALDRLAVTRLGLVVIGARSAVTYYGAQRESFAWD